MPRLLSRSNIVMSIGAAAEAMMRRKLLERIYDRMTPDERQLFVHMTMQNRSHTEIMQALQRQQTQLADLHKHQQPITEDFLSNLAGNATWDGILWLARRLFK